jgi:hypothetical protein
MGGTLRRYVDPCNARYHARVLADDLTTSIPLALRSVDALARRLGASGEPVSVGALLRELQAPGAGPVQPRLATVRKLRGEVRDVLEEALGCATDLAAHEDELADAGLPRALATALDVTAAGIDAARAKLDSALGVAGELSGRLRVSRERVQDDLDALLGQVEGVLESMQRHAVRAVELLRPLSDWSDEHDQPGSPEALVALEAVLARLDEQARRPG